MPGVTADLGAEVARLRMDPSVRPIGGESIPPYLFEIPCAQEHKVSCGMSASGHHFQHGDHRMTLASVSADPLAEFKAFVQRCHDYDEDADER